MRPRALSCTASLKLLRRPLIPDTVLDTVLNIRFVQSSENYFECPCLCQISSFEFWTEVTVRKKCHWFLLKRTPVLVLTSALYFVFKILLSNQPLSGIKNEYITVKMAHSTDVGLQSVQNRSKTAQKSPNTINVCFIRSTFSEANLKLVEDCLT